METVRKKDKEVIRSYFIAKIKDILIDIDEPERVNLLVRTLKYVLNADAVGFYIPENDNKDDYFISEGMLDGLLSSLNNLKTANFNVTDYIHNNGCSYLAVPVDINDEIGYILVVNNKDNNNFYSEDIDIIKKIISETKDLINKKAISREGKSANNPSLSLSPHKSPLLP